MAKKKKTFNLVKILLASVLGLALVQIFISHRLATAGKLVAEFETETVRIKAENERLEEKINQEGSLAIISQKATELGFKPIDQIVYLTSEVPVALGH